MEIQFVQTRSKMNGIEQHENMKEAYERWLSDRYIWKISFDEDDINRRFRTKTKKDVWNPYSEEKISELCPQYTTANVDQIFWIDQAMFPDDYDDWDILKKRKDVDYENRFYAACIRLAFTDEQFRIFYCEKKTI